MRTTLAARLELTRERLPPWLRPALAALLLFSVNAFLCRGLFGTEFTRQTGSIESSYMTVCKWVGQHGGGLTWFPLWFSGMPFTHVYQPAFHVAVATLAAVTHWTTQHAYHFFTALEYCLGPVTLFWLCFRATGWIGFSFSSGLLYSLISPASVLVPLIRYDTGNLITARRFIVLTRYGEGPHTTAVMLIPLVLLAIHYAVTSRRRWTALAAIPLALLVLTNWPGTMGFCMALLAYAVSRLQTGRSTRWFVLPALAVVAYMLACPWIPPSVIRLVQRNAQLSDATIMTGDKFIAWGGILIALVLLHLLFQRFGTHRWLRFFVYFTFITGVVAIGREWFGWRAMPQPHRFQVEFELACLPVAAWLGKMAYDRLNRFGRIGFVLLFLLVCGYQGYRFKRYARRETQPIDMSATIEYRMAMWFDANMHGRRVFAPANVSYWMNMFTNTPQVSGCCDQGIPVQEDRIRDYVIYTGQNAGSRDAEISILWLKSYGADAIGVSGPASTEYFHPYWNAKKFDGVLPALWRNGDNAVYDVQRRSQSLAHVLTPAEVVRRPPENGLDIAPLVPFVNAMESPSAPPANFRWEQLDSAHIDAEVLPGQVVSVQVSYDPAWRATVAGADRSISSDALGLIVIDPKCTGHCSIDLHWGGGTEAAWMRILQLLGVALMAAWILWEGRRPRLKSEAR